MPTRTSMLSTLIGAVVLILTAGCATGPTAEDVPSEVVSKAPWLGASRRRLRPTREGTVMRRTRTTRGGFAFLLTLVLALTATLVWSGTAMADPGVQCVQTGLESVTTDQESYPPGETVYISGGGFAVACDVELRITRPDGVVATAGKYRILADVGVDPRGGIRSAA
jgi:hypothetical protein